MRTYHQFSLDKDFIDKSAIITPLVYMKTFLCVWNMRFSSIAQSFQQFIDKVLCVLDCCVVHLDDALFFFSKCVITL